MIQKIMIGGLAICFAVVGSSPVYARDDGTPEGTTRGVVKQTESSAEAVRSESSKSVAKASESVESQKEYVEARKSELLDRLAQKQSERKEKLQGQRLAQCENRQKNINSLIDKSVITGRTHLANIQRVQAKVTKFYEKKELSSPEYDSAYKAVLKAEGDAKAAVEVMSTQDFDCVGVDGAKPSGLIHTSHETKKESLKAYRQSVIELIKVTKEAYVAQRSEASDAQN